ncbi:hypothetical protein KSD_17340 [Ktedonobacter sp. SOSP1-85]|uniref:BREX system P-loop protein BrxC n=1 Tax=Ktedonobacter sp. SOSP1-85 TaxID=2778367 RepID=UPI001914E18F|nr:BREX system P-loop protein BrxC [Ktedonobacter sp. SOSP1-85]GHO73963.1 hypothetical protein KSD_17340 [Ktedonobacter sp. SOSP1-85]
MLKNRDIFLENPTTHIIPNNGVAQVINPSTIEEWNVLHYELSHFVCEGEYQRGLQLILSTYLASIHETKQPAIWVSGFYGSGKSHFVRVLEYLWRDTTFPDGAHARGLAKLPDEIADLLKELTIAGRREGGLWSAAGTLGAGAGKSVRLALLGILFRSADLPEQYAPARFVIWLIQQGYYADVKAGVANKGSNFSRELRNMYVSNILAESLLEVYPAFANSAAEARSLLKAQYPNKEDISDDELLSTMRDVLELQSTTPGKLPCTLLIFDELQQFIGDDSRRAEQVQLVVETCSSRFGNRLLFIATGQAAIVATPQLQKLQGRFTVRVSLTDTDVERVVREVVLRKQPTQVPALQTVLDAASGEINRHLAGTRIGPRPTDKQHLIPDYPLLPARSRFWESVLRAVDSMGMAGQLRTQLRIVHDAIKEIANEPLGTVVAGDVIYNQLKTEMIQSSVLLRDVATAIEQMDDGTADGKLRSRLSAIIFLISKLPTEGVAATGLRANVETLADLLVGDVADVNANAKLRQCIPTLLQSLVDSGQLMRVGEEYRLQTPEGAEWEQDYQQRRIRIWSNDTRIADDRTTQFKSSLDKALKGIRLTQGVSKTPRQLEAYFTSDAPAANTERVPVWIRDEWSVSAKTVRADAQAAGADSPIVFVFLPRQEADALKDALASSAAAQETIASRPAPTTNEGQEAKRSMETKRQAYQGDRDALIANIVNNAHVYQGGGNEVSLGSLQDSVKKAVEDALVRLFPKFSLIDHASWGTVVRYCREGNTDPLAVVGYHGDIDKHPACQEIRAFIGGAGKKGRDIHTYFEGVGYGWQRDAVDGALLSLVAGGFVRAAKDGQAVPLKQIISQQIGLTEFYSEGVTISTSQRIGVRNLLTNLGFSIKPGEEVEAIPVLLKHLMELAASAGGEAPRPEPPTTDAIKQLQALSGNALFVAVYNGRADLLNSSKTWTQASAEITRRWPQWLMLQRLLAHASSLPVAAEVEPQINAIKSSRALLHNPDPVSPLLQKVTTALRTAVQDARQRLIEAQERELRSLETFQEWQSLAEAERQRLLQKHELGSVPTLKIGTDEELLATLDTTSIATWAYKIDAPKGRVQRVREETAKLHIPEAQHITVTHATLKSVDEADAYLAALRTEIMMHISAGKPVII